MATCEKCRDDCLREPAIRSGFRVFLEKSPSSGRRHALSSGLSARDKLACVMQAPAKCCEAQHGTVRDKPSQPEIKCDISPISCGLRLPLARSLLCNVLRTPVALNRVPKPGASALGARMKVSYYDAVARCHSGAQCATASSAMRCPLADSSSDRFLDPIQQSSAPSRSLGASRSCTPASGARR